MNAEPTALGFVGFGATPEREQLLNNLIGKEVYADRYDERTNKRFVVKGTTLDRDMLATISTSNLGRIRCVEAGTGTAGSVRRATVTAIPKPGSALRTANQERRAQDREAAATIVIDCFAGTFQKIAEHSAAIRFLRSEFKKLQPGERVRDCETWAEFCPRHLGRTHRAVNYMLAGQRREPSTIVLSRDRKIQMGIANLTKLVKDDAPRAMEIAQHFSNLAQTITNASIMADVPMPEWPNSRGSIVGRAKELTANPRTFVEKVVDFITRRAA